MLIPTLFNRHILDRHTQLYPIIAIGSYVNTWSDNTIVISTNHTNLLLNSLDQTSNIQKETLPILLNIPSLKEAIDITQKNYKISKMTLDVSNTLHNNIRFSELVKNNNIINQECRIFWATSSTDTLIAQDIAGKDIDNEVEINYAFQIYLGRIYKYNLTDDKVRIDVEDISLKYLNKELPLNWLDDTENVPKMYRNKPIPMVYGEVDKSPCVIGKNKNILMDSQNIRSLVTKTDPTFNETIDGLYIGEQYLPVPKIVEDNLHTLEEPKDEDGNINVLRYDDRVLGVQWKHSNESDSNIKLGYSYLARNNIVQCKIFHPPSDIELLTKSADDDVLVDILTDEDKNIITDKDPTTYVNIGGDTSHTTGTYPGTQDPPLGIGFDVDVQTISTCLFYNLKINTTPPALEDADIIKVHRIKLNGYKLPVGRNFPSQLGNDIVSAFATNSAGSYINGNLGLSLSYGWALLNDSEIITYGESLVGLIGFPNWFDGGAWAGDLDSNTNEPFSIEGDINFYFSPEHTGNILIPESEYRSEWVRFVDNATGLEPNGYLYEVQLLGALGSGTTNLYDTSANLSMTGTISGKLKDITIKTYADVKDILGKKFYAHVKGRNIHDSASRNHLPFHILRHIYQTELGYSGEIIYDSPTSEHDIPPESDPGNDGGSYKLDFTIDKKINAKKLIQGISASSPLITRFDSMGKLRFDIIRPTYVKGDGKEIKSSDVISFTYARTNIDAVKTNIVLRYKKDYASDEFIKTKTFGIDDGITQIQNIVVTDAESMTLYESVIAVSYSGLTNIEQWVLDCITVYLEATNQSFLNFQTYMTNAPQDVQIEDLLIDYFGQDEYAFGLGVQLLECAYWLIYNNHLEANNYTWVDIGTLSTYQLSYYGFDSNSDTEMIVDDERSEYIRRDQTADIFIKKLLYWYCNQHLIIKARLPLKYLSLEVGSIIVYDNVIGDVNPYGINYGKNGFYGGYFGTDPDYYVGSNVNGQQAFPQFMIISTKKTLEYVEIEAIQMHNLTSTPVVFHPTYGPKTPDAYGRPPINFNPDVAPTFSDDSEIHPEYSYDNDKCGLGIPGSPELDQWEDDNQEDDWNPQNIYQDNSVTDSDGNLLGGYIGSQTEGWDIYRYFAFYTWEGARTYWLEMQQSSSDLQFMGNTDAIVRIVSSPGHLDGGCIPNYSVTIPRLDSIEFKFQDGLGIHSNIKEIYPNSLLDAEQNIYLGHPSYALMLDLIIKPSVTTYFTTNHVSTDIKLVMEYLDPDSSLWVEHYDSGFQFIGLHSSFMISDLVNTEFIPDDWFQEEQQNLQWRINIYHKMTYEEAGDGNRDHVTTIQNSFQMLNISYLVGAAYSQEQSEFEPIENSQEIINTTNGLFSIYRLNEGAEMTISFSRENANYINNYTWSQFWEYMQTIGAPNDLTLATQIVLYIDWDNIEDSGQATTLQNIEDDFESLNNEFVMSTFSLGADPSTGEQKFTTKFRYDGEMIWTATSLIGLLPYINIGIYTTNTEEIFGVYGDVTGDGIVNVMDIVTLVNVVLGDVSPSDIHDISGDGVVNVLDIIILVNIILG